MYKVGQRVKYNIPEDSFWHGKEGTITRIFISDYGNTLYRVNHSLDVYYDWTLVDLKYLDATILNNRGKKFLPEWL
jgi:hypothetical protein